MKKLAIFIVLLLIFTGCMGKDIEKESSKDEDIVEVDQDIDEKIDESIDIDVEDNEDTEPDIIDEKATYRPVATMIENSPNARPQSGLIDADVVYEIYVEGGITRFLAIFMSDYPKIVGPIRSARHYYLDIVEEWDALYVHYGASAMAKEQFSKRPIERVDGIEGNKLFWRDSSRVAPHNAYVDIEQCEKLIDFDQNKREIKFTKKSLITGDTYSSITIPYNSTFSKVEYTYDEKTQKNMRGTSGTPSVDKEKGEQLFADNIIIQYADHERMDSGVGYKKIDLFGSGKATYFIDGKFFEGTWERENLNTPTLFLDRAGDEVAFIEGNIWIHIVPPNMKITVD